MEKYTLHKIADKIGTELTQGDLVVYAGNLTAVTDAYPASGSALHLRVELLIISGPDVGKMYHPILSVSDVIAIWEVVNPNDPF
jgi:hypothetical protein